MDNASMSDPAEPAYPLATTTRFVPDRRFTAMSAVGAVIAVGLAALDSDAGARLLALIAAVMLAVAAASDVVFSPRLEVSAAGVVIRSPLTRAELAWHQIEAVGISERMRLGLRNRALEVDAGEVLAEFTRRTLGTDIDEALALIEAYRPV